MSKGTRWTPEQLKKLGYVESRGKMVQVKTLVNHGKVEKIEPSVTTFQQSEIERLNNRIEWKETNGKSYDGSTINHVIHDIECPMPSGEKAHNGFEPVRLPNGEIVYPTHYFDLEPHPAPRMTRSDKWKTDPHHADPEKRQRKAVQRYFAFRDAFLALAAQNGYRLEDRLHVLFVFPMPDYWNRKKKAEKIGTRHRQRPDADNCAKSIMDAFGVDDGHVWDLRAVKVWGDKGQIIIF